MTTSAGVNTDKEGRTAAPPELGGRRPAVLDLTAIRRFTIRHRGLLLVLLAYAATMAVVPVLTPIPLSDDWTYTRSVEILLEEGRLQILEIAGASAIPQILWGALFALASENVFGALRVATVVFTAASGVALYGICRELGLTDGRAGLGAAIFLFNPLVFSLSYTFMTDNYYLGLLTISSYFLVRGLRKGSEGSTATLVGACFAALAVTQRVMGVLIPIAVVVHHLTSGRIRVSRAGVASFLRVVGPPLLAFVLFLAWQRFVHGVPAAQQSFSDQVLDATWAETWLLVRRLTYIQMMYIGMFTLPIAAAGLVLVPRALRSLTVSSWLVVLATTATLVAGLSFFAADGRLMPYVPHFLSIFGLGPNDLVMGREPVFAVETLRTLTYATGLSVLVVVTLLALRLQKSPLSPTQRRNRSKDGLEERLQIRLVLLLALFQTVAVLLPSFAFRSWTSQGLSTPSLDRYMLPLLPFAIVLAIWAVCRQGRALEAVAWPLVAAMAAFSLVGTRDSLVHHEAVWALATWTTEQGVDITQLDAGYAWDAYHTQELSFELAIPPQTLDAPWWLTSFATVIDSSYVIAGQPIADYPVVREQPYRLWLGDANSTLYLLRRPDRPWPPAPD
jgi:hypothetical protein